jgi:hypothetical protein
MPTESTFLVRFKRQWLSALLFLIPLALTVANAMFLYLPEIVQHIALTITAVMGIHLLDRLFLFKDTEQAFERLIQVVRSDIARQSSLSVSASHSLQAMQTCGISQIYSSRKDAANDIQADLLRSGNSKIRLMGISLNDFVQGRNDQLKEAWESIKTYVRKKGVDQRPIDIQVLIIDPLCFGAELRSKAESRSKGDKATHLQSDLSEAARDLLGLSEAHTERRTGVTFECKLYRLPPIMFLCWVDSVCYVQQYHFLSSQDATTSTPVLKFHNSPSLAQKYPYHAEMEAHFNWVWENASVSLTDYLEGGEVGTDMGIHQCGAMNIYTKPEKGLSRIIYLVKRAEHQISIQGISLSSFFKPGQELWHAILNVIEAGKVDLKVLILEPESEQAMYRSYRERLFIEEAPSFKKYMSEKDHEKSELYEDTQRTIKHIKQMISRIASAKREPVGWVPPKFAVGLYRSAPACFILRVDDHVLVEQYHYGKIGGEGARTILGKDMPLVEYCKAPPHVDEKGSDRVRRPFDLLEDHFQYAFARSTKLFVEKDDPNRAEA